MTQIQAVTAISIKELNRRKVYAIVYAHPGISKMGIVEMTSMSLSTVEKNLKSLIDENLLCCDGYLESTGGRKAQAFKINEKYRLTIGVGILKHHLYIVAVSLSGSLIASVTHKIDYSANEAYFENFALKINEFISTLDCNPQDILEISIAIQGIVSKDHKRVTYGKIFDNKNFNLEKAQTYLNYPCRLFHDSKAAAFCQLWQHPQINDATVVLLNRYLGGALIIGKHIINGQNNVGGLIEHICVNREGPLCYCGARGCLDVYCSALALAERAQCDLNDFFKKLRNKDQNAKLIWENYLSTLGQALANTVKLTDGDIILSGLLADFMNEEDLNTLFDYINFNNAFTLSRDRLILGKGGDLVPALGAALNCINRFLYDLGAEPLPL